MLKKICSTVFLLLICSLVFASSLFADTKKDIKIMVNNKLIKSEAAPFIDTAGRTMVPLRFVSEALGCKVEWYSDLKMAAIDTPKKDTLIFEIESDKYYLNYGEPILMESKAVVLSGRTYVPLRLIAEILEFDVEWQKESRTINLSKHKSA